MKFFQKLFPKEREQFTVSELADRLADLFVEQMEVTLYNKESLLWKFGNAKELNPRDVMREWSIVLIFFRVKMFRKHFKDVRTAEAVLDHFHVSAWSCLVEKNLVADEEEIDALFRNRYAAFHEAESRSTELYMKLFRVSEKFFQFCQINCGIWDITAATTYFTTLLVAEKKLAESLSICVDIRDE